MYSTQAAWTGPGLTPVIRNKIPVIDGLNNGRALEALTCVRFVQSDPTTFPVLWVSLSGSLQMAGLSP